MVPLLQYFPFCSIFFFSFFFLISVGKGGLELSRFHLLWFHNKEIRVCFDGVGEPTPSLKKTRVFWFHYSSMLDRNRISTYGAKRDQDIAPTQEISNQTISDQAFLELGLCRCGALAVSTSKARASLLDWIETRLFEVGLHPCGALAVSTARALLCWLCSILNFPYISFHWISVSFPLLMLVILLLPVYRVGFLY